MDWISRQEDNGKTDGLFGKTDWQWERLRTSGKTDGDTGLVTATNKVNDSPMIVREGGVEEQSSTERITWNLDTVKILGQQQRTPHNQILQPPELETNSGRAKRNKEKNAENRITRRRNLATDNGKNKQLPMYAVQQKL